MQRIGNCACPVFEKIKHFAIKCNSDMHVYTYIHGCKFKPNTVANIECRKMKLNHQIYLKCD